MKGKKKKGSGTGPVSLECKCKSVNHSAVSNSLRPHGLGPVSLLCPWNSPGKNTGVGSHSLLQGVLPDPGIEAWSLALQEDSLLSEPPGKPWKAATKGERFLYPGKRLTGGRDQERVQRLRREQQLFCGRQIREETCTDCPCHHPAHPSLKYTSAGGGGG